MEFKEDVQIKVLPRCTTEGCNNDGLCFVHSKLLCSECLIKWHEKRQKILIELGLEEGDMN